MNDLMVYQIEIADHEMVPGMVVYRHRYLIALRSDRELIIEQELDSNEEIIAETELSEFMGEPTSIMLPPPGSTAYRTTYNPY